MCKSQFQKSINNKMTQLLSVKQSQDMIPRRQFADSRMRRVTFQSAATHDQFQNGPHRALINLSGKDRYIVPSRSYLHVQLKITKSNGDALTRSDNIALATNACSTLFDGVDFQIGSESIGPIGTRQPEIDTFTQRIENGGDRLDGMLNDFNSWGSWNERQELLLGATEKRPKYCAPQSIFALGYATTTKIAVTAGVATFTVTLPAEFNWKVGDRLVIAGVVHLVTATDKANHTVTLIVEATGVAPADIADGVITASHMFAVPEVYYSKTENVIDLNWTPSTPFFTSVKGLVPATPGMELLLTPNTNYKRAVIESRGVGTKIPDTHYAVTVQKMYLYLYTLRSAPFDGDEYWLDMSTTSAQTQKVETADVSEAVFQVNPRTEAIGIAFMDRRWRNDTRVSQTLFKTYSKDITYSPIDQHEAHIKRLKVEYAGRQYPENEEDLNVLNGRLLLREYYRNLLFEGKLDMDSKVESYQTWKDRGLYYYIRTDKDGLDQSTRVNVTYDLSFGGTTDDNISNMDIVLFSTRRLLVHVKLDPVTRQVMSVTKSG